METVLEDDGQQRVLLDAVRRYIPLIIVFAVVFAIAGGLAGLARPSSYTASTKVLIASTTGNPLSAASTKSGQQVTVAMTTEAAVVTSPKVAASAAESLDIPTTAAVGAVVATVPPNTQLIDISYTASNATNAQTGAAAFATAYLDHRRTVSRGIIDAQLSTLQDQEKSVTTNLKSASNAAAILDSKPDANAEVQLYASRLATIQDNIATAESTPTDPGTVIAPATKPTAPAGMQWWLFAVASGVVGLLLGLALAIWRARADDRIRTGRVSVVYGLPVLAAVPAAGRKGRSAAESDDQHGPVAESYRRARAGIVASSAPTGNVLAVAGVGQDAPVADVVLNLGTALSRAGRVTTVVDATAGAEDLSALAGGSTGPSLAELMGGKRPMATSATSGMRVVAGNTDPSQARDMFHSDRLRGLIEELRSDSEFVLMACQDVESSPGSGVVLAARRVVLVVQDRRTSLAAVAEAIRRCAELDAQVIGLIAIPRGRSRGSDVANPVEVTAAKEPTSPEEPSPTEGGAQDTGAGASAAGQPKVSSSST